MQIHDLIQGSPQWLAHRAHHFNASDAAAMLGVSPHKRRGQLLHEVFTGIPREPSDYAEQHVLAPGHRFEALARPLGEGIIGEDLYPVTGSEGRMSASFDGLTMSEGVAWEHKRLNDELRACMRDGIGGDELPIHHRIQMEQQLLVSGAERVLFTASEWNGEQLIEARHCWYISDSALRASIVDGWAQFEKDLAAYVLPTPEPAAPVAKVAASLPVVFDMRVEGKLVSCNLAQYKPAALTYIASINTELKTDQHFVDAVVDAKFCRESASKLELAIEQALGQVGDINNALNTVREIAASFDAKGLALEKLVDKRKAEIKESIILTARDAFCAHLAALDAEIAPIRLGLPLPDLAGAAKGKRTVATLQDAVDTALANAKIAADAQAKEWRTKLAWYREEAADLTFLFADLQGLIQKPLDDFKLAVTTRIADHKAAEAKRKTDADAAAALTAQTIATAAAPAPARPIFQTVVAAIGLPAAAPAAAPSAAPWDDPAPNLVTLLDDLLAHIDKAFDCKFPSHPKPLPSWWSELLRQSTALREATAD